MRAVRKNLAALLTGLLLLLPLCACEYLEFSSETVSGAVSLADVPDYSGEPYVILNQGQPEFDQGDYTTEAFEYYSDQDALGRCGVAYANVCVELMPTEERGAIGQVKPSGWHTVTYDFVDGRYLYNRCHLIGFQLTGENANEENLITGTRYMNVDGMLPFENMVADYVTETECHVLYRVTPVFEGNNLVASGVQMEAVSVEDRGESICYNVYVYNCQPGIEIDYATGESWLTAESDASETEEGEEDYVLNTSSKKFHLPDCSGIKNMNPDNRQSYTGSRQALIDQGYEPCGSCKP